MFEGASSEQARAILAAARQVVQLEPDPMDPRSGRGNGVVVAAGRLLFRPSVEIDVHALPRIEPQELARAIGTNQNLAEHAAALIACASLADGLSDPDRLRRVVEYAHAMHIRDGWVREILQVARGHLAWAMADMTRRNISTFPGWANPDDTLKPMMPYQDQSDADKRLAERFLSLEQLPKSTYGHQFWAHFRRHGFAFPGEKNAFTSYFAVPHDGLHVLSGYSTSIQGELLVSTFTGAMHRRDALRAHILPVIFQWHVGTEVNGIGAQQGAVLLGHDRVAGREAEAGSFAWLLCREERVEDLCLRRLGDAGSVVLDFDHRPVTVAAGADRDRSRAVHGVDGVVEQVRPDLVQLAAVGRHRERIAVVFAMDVDAVLQFGAQNDERVVEPLVQVDRLNRCLPEERVALEGGDDLGDSPGGFTDLVQQLMDGEGARCADQDCGERLRFERVRELRECGQVEPLVDERWSELPAVGDSVLVQPVLDGRLVVGPLERVEIARARCPSER